MWDELSVEREVDDDELASAIARGLGVDRERITVVASMERAPTTGIVVEKRPYPGDFALRVGLFHVDDGTDRVAFYRALAAALGCKLLVDDGDLNPYTAMLVMRDGATVRVNLDAGALDRADEALVIAGLYEHVDRDEAPDPTAHAPAPPKDRRHYRRTRGERLAQTVNDYLIEGTMPAFEDRDAFMAAYTPEVQDAEHEVTALLRELVHRAGTSADERVLRRCVAILRPMPAGGLIREIVRCADDVLAQLPWDPNAG